jgi:Uma2 family endonuclease
MATLVLDPEPPELRALRERRHLLDQDRADELWDGVYHMNPAPGLWHALVEPQVVALLHRAGCAAGLTPVGEFNLGEEHDYRVPDAGLQRALPSGAPVFLPTAALVLEIVSPADRSWEKLPFYAAHGVDELVLVDPAGRAVHWLALLERRYRSVEQSALIELGRSELAAAISWP